MIISHSREVCYWKVARTGSNTVELCIRLCNVLDLSRDIVTRCHFFPSSHNVIDHQSGHTTPAEAIALGALTQQQFDRYTHYMMVRDPIQRFVSAYGYHMRNQLNHPTLSPQQFHDDCKEELVARKQSDYVIPGGTVLPFADYENSVRQIVAAFGGELRDVPKIEHKTQRGWRRRALLSIIDIQRGDDHPLRDQLREYYSDDFRLYELHL